MARIRTVKPEFWTDEAVGECSPTARLLFLGTLNFADDYGDIERSAKQLKAQIFPYDDIDCEPLVQELLRACLLIEYEVDGRKYLHIKGFSVHQKVEKPGRPRLPLPVFSGSPPRMVGESSEETPRGRESKGRESRGMEAHRGVRVSEQSGNPPRIVTDDAGNDSRGTRTPEVTRAGAVCVAMKAEGMIDVTPSHPLLLELLRSGAEIGEFADAARRAVADGKRFAYALAIVRGQRADAAKQASAARVPAAAKRTWQPPDDTEEHQRAQG